MPSDRPGMIMLRRLLDLLQAPGEGHVSSAKPAVALPEMPAFQGARREAQTGS